MTDAVRHLVYRRAAGRCEYCHLPESGHEERFSIDHIIASQHHVDDSIENLAPSCLRSNLHKGTNLSGLDPSDMAIVRLYHPRKMIWSDHLRWNGPMLTGITPTGRATVATMRMNSPARFRLRQMLLLEGILTLD
jgi:hypothetical protein